MKRELIIYGKIHEFGCFLKMTMTCSKFDIQKKSGEIQIMRRVSKQDEVMA